MGHERIEWIPDPGYWAIANHEVVAAISADSTRFCSSRGILVAEIGSTYDSPPTMMHTDPPDHTVYRALVQPAFGRRRMKTLEDSIRARVEPVAAVLCNGEVHDLVDLLAVPVPIHVIIELLGIDHVETSRVKGWSDAAIPDAMEMSDEDRMAAMGDMVTELITTAARRREDPAADVLSELTNAEVTLDGVTHRLDDTELAMFGVQLVVAGNETTRNAIAGGLIALAQRPDQWQRLVDDPTLVPLAVEEILRWTSPVVSFLRTAVVDVTLPVPRLDGAAPDELTIAANDPVLLLYGEANRDPIEFGDSADLFDVGRTPNHHLAFGFGTHFCLGAALARIEIRVVLEALLAQGRMPSLVGDVRYSPSQIIAGVEFAEVQFLPA